MFKKCEHSYKLPFVLEVVFLLVCLSGFLNNVGI